MAPLSLSELNAQYINATEILVCNSTDTGINAMEPSGATLGYLLSRIRMRPISFLLYAQISKWIILFSSYCYYIFNNFQRIEYETMYFRLGSVSKPNFIYENQVLDCWA